MRDKIVNWLCDLQRQRAIFKSEDRRLYEYAYRLLLNRVLIYVIIAVLGFLTGNWLEMFSFLLPFIFLRQYVGGIHLKKATSCICVSGILVFVCGKYLAIDSTMGIPFWIAWIFSIVIIFSLSPVDTGNKRLDEVEKKIYGKRARIVLIIEFILVLCFGMIEILIVAKGIAVAHIILAGSLILGLIGENFFTHKLVDTNI